MHSTITSRDEILKVCRDMIQKDGWTSVNIRALANACDISVGSVYNYFNSKADLTASMIESVWRDIFCLPQDPDILHNILSCITWIFQRLKDGEKRYPGFFHLHAVSFFGEEKEDGKERMLQSWQHVMQVLCTVLQQDPQIRPNAFTDTFTREHFADLLFSLILSALLRNNYDPSPVLEVIRRTVY
nr:TetR/AcrR family transcriptional regulator [Agathobaculum sp. Marseille-P7918]